MKINQENFDKLEKKLKEYSYIFDFLNYFSTCGLTQDEIELLGVLMIANPDKTRNYEYTKPKLVKQIDDLIAKALKGEK